MSATSAMAHVGDPDPDHASAYLRPFEPRFDAPLPGGEAVDWDSGPNVERGRFAMWLFLGSEALFFAALITVYAVLRQVQDAWPSADRLQRVPATWATAVLVASSATAYVAVRATRTRRAMSSAAWCAISALLGVVFLVLQGWEWRALWIAGTRPSSDLFGSTFYTLTGLHGAHVLGGIAALSCAALLRARRPASPDSAAWVENAVLYWHFVDLVWLVLFVLIYRG